MKKNGQAGLSRLTRLKLLKLVGCILIVLVLILDNIKVPSFERKLKPIFNASIYPIGLEQNWNMFVGDQVATLAVRVKNVHRNNTVTYVYSNMGQKPYLWPNKQRNLDWGLVAIDNTGVYRASYLNYLCRHDKNLKTLTYQAAFLSIPTVTQPNYDPFTDTANYGNLTTVRCQQ